MEMGNGIKYNNLALWFKRQLPRSLVCSKADLINGEIFYFIFFCFTRVINAFNIHIRAQPHAAFTTLRDTPR